MFKSINFQFKEAQITLMHEISCEDAKGYFAAL